MYKRSSPRRQKAKGLPPLNCGSPNIQDALRIGEVPSSQSGEGNCNPLQYSCLENPTDREARLARVRGFARVGHDLATNPPPLELLELLVGSCAYFPGIKVSQTPPGISHSAILACLFLSAPSSPKMLPLPGILSCPIPFLLVGI